MSSPYTVVVLDVAIETLIEVPFLNGNATMSCDDCWIIRWTSKTTGPTQALRPLFQEIFIVKKQIGFHWSNLMIVLSSRTHTD